MSYVFGPVPSFQARCFRCVLLGPERPQGEIVTASPILKQPVRTSMMRGSFPATAASGAVGKASDNVQLPVGAGFSRQCAGVRRAVWDFGTVT